MPRLRHVTTGAVVNVSDYTAARLGSSWGPAQQEKTAAKRSSAKTSSKQSDDKS